MRAKLLSAKGDAGAVGTPRDTRNSRTTLYIGCYAEAFGFRPAG